MTKPTTRSSLKPRPSSPSSLRGGGALSWWRFTSDEAASEQAEYVIDAEDLITPTRMELPSSEELTRGVWLGREGPLALDGLEVSGRHAFLFFKDKAVHIEDHVRRGGDSQPSGSRNGTFLNESRLHGYSKLREGDLLRVGEWLGVVTPMDGSKTVPVILGEAVARVCQRGVNRKVAVTRNAVERLTLARPTNPERQIADAVEFARAQMIPEGRLRVEHLPPSYVAPRLVAERFSLEPIEGSPHALLVRFDGRSTQVRMTRGLQYVQVLVANPGKPYSAAELLQEVRAKYADPQEIDLEEENLSATPSKRRPEPVVDRKSIDDFRKRLRELEEKKRAGRALSGRENEEIVSLEKQLRQSARRPETSDGSLVAHNLETAYKKLSDLDPRTVEYLKATINRRDNAWTYHPERASRPMERES